MASLTDLFNPTFLMFLGILVLVVALVVAYFESKLREQNHKIASMFSIVSTLAEDANGMKMGINQLMHYSNTNGGSVQVQQQQPFVPYEQNTKLIEVSDDEEKSDDDSEDAEEDINSDIEDVEEDSNVEDAEEDDSSLGKYMDDMESEADSLSESDLQERVEQEKITVFKLKEDINENIENVEEDESIEDLASELSSGDLGDIENVEEEPIKEESVLDVSELKTISINLEEPVEKIDYKKLQLPKLKSIVVEKGLATSSDASKLKKAELLKLLGIE
jgi:hypothetical protein